MKFKRFMALAMAGVMTLAMTGTALAEGVFEEGLSFSKEATTAAGVTEVESSITFEIADANAFPVEDSEGNPVTYDKAGALDFGTGATFEIAGSEFTGSATKFTAEKAIDGLIKTAINGVGKPGVYYAKLHETTTPATQTDNYFGWTVVDEKYYYIAAFAAEKANSADNDKYDVVYVVYEGDAEGVTGEAKASELKFENTYNKKSGDDEQETPSLKLKKVVVNPSYVAADTSYSFSVAITLPDTAKDKDGIEHCNATAVITGEGTVGKNTITSSETALAVTLQKNAEIAFENLPVGTTVTITEDVSGLAGKNFEKATFSGDATGEGTSGSVASSNIVLDEDGASVVCTNTFKDITPTGLAISIAPFIAMFAAVGAAIALYVAAKRRVR